MSPGSFGGPVELDDAVIPKPKRHGVQDIWEEEEVEEDSVGCTHPGAAFSGSMGRLTPPRPAARQ